MKAPRGLDKALFQKLIAGEWIQRHHNLLIIGPTGVGKSWIACALGHKACRDNRSVLYQRLPRLFDALALARGDGQAPSLSPSARRSCAHTAVSGRRNSPAAVRMTNYAHKPLDICRKPRFTVICSSEIPKGVTNFRRSRHSLHAMLKIAGYPLPHSWEVFVVQGNQSLSHLQSGRIKDGF
jgi:hypothetical protein